MAEGGSASFSSTLTGGSDYTCDLCEQDDLYKESEGYCSTCSDYLCAECYRTHRRPTPLRDHVLLDKDHMPQHPKCDLCQKDGKQLEAEGFCTDCGDYLCKECFRTHLRPRPLRNHVLLDKSQMPRVLQDRGNDMKTRAEYVKDILVKSQEDETDTYITGCAVLSADELVVVDLYNSKVKLIDLTTNAFSAQLKLPKFLWDVTQVNSKQVAITSHSEETIYFVNVNDSSTLELDHKVKVDGRCRGIASMGDKLVVSYDHPAKKVEIFSMTGNVLQTIAIEVSRSYYIASNAQANIIYIADTNCGKIKSVSVPSGNVLATNDTESPYGLAVDKAGAAYVCGRSTHRLIQFKSDLSQKRELLATCGDRQGPQSICYCDATDRLYIGSMYQDTMKVYQLK